MLKFNRPPAKMLIGITGSVIILAAVAYYRLHRKNSASVVSVTIQLPMDKPTVNRIIALDRQNHDVNFVFINKYPGLEAMRNRVILLPPVGDELRIDFNKYVHKGHFGPLFIVLPDNYAGPKEKFILKSFPGYKGWYGTMLSNRFVMYAAK